MASAAAKLAAARKALAEAEAAVEDNYTAALEAFRADPSDKNKVAYKKAQQDLSDARVASREGRPATHTMHPDMVMTPGSDAE